MKRAQALVAAGLAGCGGPAGRLAPPGSFEAPPGLVVDARERYYDVAGPDLAVVKSTLEIAGPRIDGERHVAATAWRVEWRFAMGQDARGCRITDVFVRVDLDTLYPRWTDVNAADPRHGRRWRGFMGALRFHEDRHRRNGLEAGAEAIRRLWQVLPQPSCAALEGVANGVVEQVTEKWRRADRQFDDATHHGATQGALLR